MYYAKTRVTHKCCHPWLCRYPNLVMVDYTVPDVIHSMADFYVRHRLPFVMGTTGGDRAKLTQQVCS